MSLLAIPMFDLTDYVFEQILHNELEQSLRSSEQQLEKATSELDRQKHLNEKLENDLLSINQDNDQRSATHSEIDLLANLDIGRNTPIRSTPIPFTPSADTSILPIVTSQRDRFRQRNAELEEVCVLRQQLF
jgi:homeobox protein cut-like